MKLLSTIAVIAFSLTLSLPALSITKGGSSLHSPDGDVIIFAYSCTYYHHTKSGPDRQYDRRIIGHGENCPEVPYPASLEEHAQEHEMTVEAFGKTSPHDCTYFIKQAA